MYSSTYILQHRRREGKKEGEGGGSYAQARGAQHCFSPIKSCFCFVIGDYLVISYFFTNVATVLFVTTGFIATFLHYILFFVLFVSVFHPFRGIIILHRATPGWTDLKKIRCKNYHNDTLTRLSMKYSHIAGLTNSNRGTAVTVKVRHGAEEARALRRGAVGGDVPLLWRGRREGASGNQNATARRKKKKKRYSPNGPARLAFPWELPVHLSIADKLQPFGPGGMWERESRAHHHSP